MSKVLTVPTHFNDIGELCEGFLDRVEEDILILYGPVAYEDGAEIAFTVLLADGAPALEGTAVVRAAVDGGSDRVPDTRYDVVLEQLNLEGRYEVVFERLLLARQAVSERPSPEEPMSVPPGEVVSIAPQELEREADEASAIQTNPPEASFSEKSLEEGVDDHFEEDEDVEPSTVVAQVDAEALMAEATEQDAFAVAFREQTFDEGPDGPEGAAEADAGEQEPTFEGRVELDSMYAFEHGIAAEPRVGMPVPMPSMAAPPEAPPSPPRLRLAEPPQGLTRPSLAKPEELHFTTEDEVSDVHTTGLFAYEDGLPIPSRPPLPDLARPRRATPIEAADASDVQETDDDDYEELRLSDFAGAAEEG